MAVPVEAETEAVAQVMARNLSRTSHSITVNYIAFPVILKNVAPSVNSVINLFKVPGITFPQLLKGQIGSIQLLQFLHVL